MKNKMCEELYQDMILSYIVGRKYSLQYPNGRSFSFDDL